MANPTADLRQLDVPALLAQLAEEKGRAFTLRLENVTGKLDNTSRIREVRRQIARINTVIREREIAAAEAEEKR
jgi:large subunit ribosomal protein L29